MHDADERSVLTADALASRHAREFRRAWDEFTGTCYDTVAPEATYQAWLAHFMIMRVGLIHVVREVDFGARHLGEVVPRFRGSSLMIDVMVLRKPIVNLPRRAALTSDYLPEGDPNPRSGLARLRDFSVICELKVSATQMGGLNYTAVVQDFEKLSAILRAAEHQYKGAPLPHAFVGVFNNRQKPRFNFETLQRRLDAVSIHPRVQLLKFDIGEHAAG